MAITEKEIPTKNVNYHLKFKYWHHFVILVKIQQYN